MNTLTAQDRVRAAKRQAGDTREKVLAYSTIAVFTALALVLIYVANHIG